MKDIKFQIIRSAIVALILFAVSCAIHKTRTVIEPANIALIDESRIDNTKVRHIFKEFLISDIVNQSKKWLTLFDLDTIERADIDPEYVDHLVSFDVMSYGIADLNKNIDKMLVSVRIINLKTDHIVYTLIESAEGQDVEFMCRQLVLKIGAPLVQKLSELQTRKYDLPDVLNEPSDSTQIEPQDSTEVESRE